MPSSTSKLTVVKALAVTGLAVAVFLLTPNESNSPNAETAPSQSPSKDKLPATIGSTETATPSPGSEPVEAVKSVNESASTPPDPTTPLKLPPVSAPARTDYQPPASKYKNARNPIARQALAGVGKDVDSERIWLEAINDPNLPANERQDLIEDLNEDGISNPAQPTDRDLTLIKSRIALIENLLPNAMDQTNVAAFKEAQKDLLNMLKRLER